MAEEGTAHPPLKAKRGAALLDERIVHFGQLGRELAEIEPGELGPRRSAPPNG